MMDSGYVIVMDLLTDHSPSTQKQIKEAVGKKNNKENSNCKETLLLVDEGATSMNESRYVRSASALDALFKVKSMLDDEGVSELIIVTSLLFKKYWEHVCIHMFSAVHTWAVQGIDVENQAVDISVPLVQHVEDNFKTYLKNIKSDKSVTVLRSDVLPDTKFNAGFHTREGGVSQARTLASLNMWYTTRKRDPVLVIQENQRRLAEAAGFDASELHITRVEHDTNVWVVGTPQPVKFDGVVTNIPGVTVAAAGADCCMILVADTKTGACGAVHSGWRGTVLGAIRNCLRTMVREFGTDPADVHAAIGPSIEASCFDLPASDATPLLELDPTLLSPSSRREGWVHADLVRSNTLMMVQEGVDIANIDTTYAVCTKCNSQYYSHQRDSIPFGSQIGFISSRKE